MTLISQPYFLPEQMVQIRLSPLSLPKGSGLFATTLEIGLQQEFIQMVMSEESEGSQTLQFHLIKISEKGVKTHIYSRLKRSS